MKKKKGSEIDLKMDFSAQIYSNGTELLLIDKGWGGHRVMASIRFQRRTNDELFISNREIDEKDEVARVVRLRNNGDEMFRPIYYLLDENISGEFAVWLDQIIAIQ